MGHNTKDIGHHGPESSGAPNKEHPHSGHNKGHHHEESGHHKEPSNHNRDHYRPRPGDHNKGQHREGLGSKANTSHQAKVTVASEKPVASAESLQEQAETHAKLKAVLKEQVYKFRCLSFRMFDLTDFFPRKTVKYKDMFRLGLNL